MKFILSLFSLFLATTVILRAMEPKTIHAAIAGNPAAIQRFIEQDPASVNQRDNGGNTPLHLAIQSFTRIEIRARKIIPAKRIIRLAGASQSYIDRINREKSQSKKQLFAGYLIMAHE